MRICCGLQLPFMKANRRAATIVESLERVKPLRQKQRVFEEKFETQMEKDQN